MSKLLFIFLLFFFYLFQILISVLSIVLSHFIPKVKKRLAFERINLTMDSSRSFKELQLKADVCFEVSSEGELEQVFPLIQAFLDKQKRVEVIYSSESVEKKCQLLYKKHPAQIRLLRMPLLSGNFFSFLYFQNIGTWMSSSKIVFCRYDFFPSLLVLKFFGYKLYLVSGCVKNVSWFKRHVFSMFHYVVAANETERQLFIKDIGLDAKCVLTCDFRIPRIYKRIDEKAPVLDSKEHLKPLFHYFDQKDFAEKVIVGSMWPSDSLIFSQEEMKKDLIANKLSVLVLPQKLDSESIKK
jgi:3-deoxy-D-manno-octulosonic-acid transferase